jgi:hypothetical protein
MPNTHEPEPTMTDGEDGRCLIIDMPAMTDEAAYQLSELLRTLAEAVDHVYHDQLLRAYRKREEERERLFHEHCMQEDWQVLPFDDELF